MQAEWRDETTRRVVNRPKTARHHKNGWSVRSQPYVLAKEGRQREEAPGYRALGVLAIVRMQRVQM